MQTNSPSGPAGFIDNSRLSAPQLVVAALCALVAMLDGFDTQAIAYVAPRIAEDWGLKPSAFGPIFSMGLVGLTLGAFLLSPVADRVGRKTIIVLSTVIFGVFALLTATANSLDQLLIYRLLTGIGLGAAMPNLIALTSEYAPARLRATAVTVMFCGFPLGSTIGGLIAAPLMRIYDWEGVFVIGGILPLLLLPVLLFALPESLRFLVARKAPAARLQALIRRMVPGVEVRRAIDEIEAEQAKDVAGFSPLQLFATGRATTTILLWVAFFMNLLVMYFLVNWLPTLLKSAGLPLSQAILSTALLNLGGVVGAIALGRLIDRMDAYLVLGCAYAASAGFIALLAFGGANLGFLLSAAALAGFGVVGAQIGCNALAASVYPTAIRATGVGWALGAGRIGAIVGPLVGGALLGIGWAPRSIILTAVGPALVASAAIFLLGVLRKTKAAAAA